MKLEKETIHNYTIKSDSIDFSPNSPYLIKELTDSEIEKDLLRKTNRERQHRLADPIVFDNDLYDADNSAMINLLFKITELENKKTFKRSTIMSDLVWRKYDNTIRQWDNIIEYENWLRALFVEISERNSNLYKESWKQKDRITNPKEQDLTL